MLSAGVLANMLPDVSFVDTISARAACFAQFVVQTLQSVIPITSSPDTVGRQEPCASLPEASLVVNTYAEGRSTVVGLKYRFCACKPIPYPQK